MTCANCFHDVHDCISCEVQINAPCKNCRFKKSYEQIAEMKMIIKRMIIDIRSVI